jgi:hypothetical protein
MKLATQVVSNLLIQPHSLNRGPNRFDGAYLNQKGTPPFYQCGVDGYDRRPSVVSLTNPGILSSIPLDYCATSARKQADQYGQQTHLEEGPGAGNRAK